MNDPNATQAQVLDEIRNIVEGITPLAFATLVTVAAMVWKEVMNDT